VAPVFGSRHNLNDCSRRRCRARGWSRGGDPGHAIPESAAPGGAGRHPDARSRIIRAAAIALALAACSAADARAHTELRSSHPAADTVLQTRPREVRLTFSEPVQLAFTRVRLLDADGRLLALGALRVDDDDPRTLTAPIPLELLPGSYRIEWQAGSRDGHVIRGEIPFAVALTASDTPPDEGAAGSMPAHPDAAAPTAGAHRQLGRASPLSRIARWAEFASLLAVIGVAAFVAVLLPRLDHFGDSARHAMQRRARALGLASAIGLVATSLLRLFAEARVVGGSSTWLDAEAAVRIAFTSSWGWGWMVAVAGAGLALAGFLMAAGRVASAWRTAAAGAAVAAVGPALTGHAIGSGALAPVAILADYLHVLAAGLWLGTLLCVMIAAVPEALGRPEGAKAPATAALIRAFHPLGLAGVTLLVGSGLVSAWIRVRSFDALTTTNYGELLLFKVYVFLFAGVIGAYNFKRLLPRLRRDTDARRFRTLGSIELVIGLVALALTAILVATASPK
jgi:copper transport protein